MADILVKYQNTISDNLSRIVPIIGKLLWQWLKQPPIRITYLLAMGTVFSIWGKRYRKWRYDDQSHRICLMILQINKSGSKYRLVNNALLERFMRDMYDEDEREYLGFYARRIEWKNVSGIDHGNDFTERPPTMIPLPKPYKWLLPLQQRAHEIAAIGSVAEALDIPIKRKDFYLVLTYGSVLPLIQFADDDEWLHFGTQIFVSHYLSAGVMHFVEPLFAFQRRLIRWRKNRRSAWVENHAVDAFRKMDIVADGYLSKEDLPPKYSKRILQMLGKGEDAKVSVEEFKQFARKYPHVVVKNPLESLINFLKTSRQHMSMKYRAYILPTELVINPPAVDQFEFHRLQDRCAYHVLLEAHKLWKTKSGLLWGPFNLGLPLSLSTVSLPNE